MTREFLCRDCGLRQERIFLHGEEEAMAVDCLGCGAEARRVPSAPQIDRTLGSYRAREREINPETGKRAVQFKEPGLEADVRRNREARIAREQETLAEAAAYEMGQLLDNIETKDLPGLVGLDP